MIRTSRFADRRIDWFIVNDSSQRFQRETLARLGVADERVLESSRVPFLRAAELIVPSTLRVQGNVSLWGCQFLRKSFLDPDERVATCRRIYLSRASARHRRVTNEEQLRRFLVGYGFEVIDASAMPVLGQARLFSAAEVVVAPHGAGLTNIVFSPPGTAVIEIFSPLSVHPNYWALSKLLGHRYIYVLGEGPLPPANEDVDHPYQDITVDIVTMCDALRQLGIRASGPSPSTIY